MTGDDSQGAILAAWLVVACVVGVLVILLLGITGCAPTVHGGWVVLNQTVVPCPTATP